MPCKERMYALLDHSDDERAAEPALTLEALCSAQFHANAAGKESQGGK